MDKLDIKKIRKDFPIFETHPGLVYLDSAASSQTATPVLKAMNDYYENFRSNVHRGLYDISQTATTKYEEAREVVAKFIGAEEKEVIFTGGSTLSINMLLYSLEQSIELKKGDRVITTTMEHHSNLIPLQELAKRNQLDLQYIDISSDFELDDEQVSNLINEKTRIVTVSLASNVLGTINDVKKIASLAHKVGAIVIVDATKAVGHIPINVKDLDCDFLFFSGHKMCGPTGIGILYGKLEWLEKLNPSFFGGGIVLGVTKEGAEWREVPAKFEAGTPNIAGAIGLAEACRYLDSLDLGRIHQHVKELADYAIEEMSKIKGLRIIGQKKTAENAGVISFLVEGIHPHDIAEIASREQVAIRAGHHCSQLLMKTLGVPATNRLGLYIYNNKNDIDSLVNAIKKARELFNV